MSDEREKRQYPRYEYSAEVRVGGPGAVVDTFMGGIVNLSVGGCLIRFDEPTVFFPNTSLEICLRGEQLVFRAAGDARRWLENGRLIGISFTHLSERGQVDLKELIRVLELRSRINWSDSRRRIAGQA